MIASGSPLARPRARAPARRAPRRRPCRRATTMRSSSIARALEASGPLHSAARRMRRALAAGRDLQVAPERDREPGRLVELGQDRVQPIHRQVVVGLQAERLLERVGRALRILGRSGQQLAERDEVTDARLAIGLDRRQPPQRDRRVGVVPLAGEPAREPGQRREIVGRRDERVPVGVDRLRAVGERALGDVADAHPGGAPHLRIRRGGDRQPKGRDRLGRAPELGLHLGEADEGDPGRRIEGHRLREHRGGLGRIARVDELGEREQPIAALGERAGGRAAAHDLRQPIVVGRAPSGSPPAPRSRSPPRARARAPPRGSAPPSRRRAPGSRRGAPPGGTRRRRAPAPWSAGPRARRARRPRGRRRAPRAGARARAAPAGTWRPPRSRARNRRRRRPDRRPPRWALPSSQSSAARVGPSAATSASWRRARITSGQSPARVACRSSCASASSVGCASTTRRESASVSDSVSREPLETRARAAAAARHSAAPVSASRLDAASFSSASAASRSRPSLCGERERHVQRRAVVGGEIHRAAQRAAAPPPDRRAARRDRAAARAPRRTRLGGGPLDASPFPSRSIALGGGRLGAPPDQLRQSARGRARRPPRPDRRVVPAAATARSIAASAWRAFPSCHSSVSACSR